MTDAAREAILAGIREGLGPPEGRDQAGPGGGARGEEPSSSPASGIPREYRRGGSAPRSDVLELFARRVSDYRARVIRVRPEELPQAVAEALERQGVHRLAVPGDLPSAWLEEVPEGALEVSSDGEEGKALEKGDLASCQGVLTGCALGIAETGTIVLDSGPAQGRRALTLLPDYHLCIVFGKQVVETVPEGVGVMGAEATGPRRPLTLVSGPSATSDIELIRVEGVHGPRNLEVVLVAEVDPGGAAIPGELP